MRQSAASHAHDNNGMPPRINNRVSSEYNVNNNNDSSNKRLKRNINFDSGTSAPGI